MVNKYKYIYILLCIVSIGCKNGIIYEKKEKILIGITSYYIEREGDKIFEIDSLMNEMNCNTPVRIEVFQKNDFNGHFLFCILLSNSNIHNMKRMPTHIIKIKNRYVFMYIRGQKPISKKSIPNELFTKCERVVMDETSWQILMCKKSLKYIIAIDNIILPIEYIKEFNEFLCE
jgi:hypothetical protein